jgi:hypothetical protein
MGAWGHGLLQNDSAQDAFLGVMDDVEADISKLARRRPSEAMAGRLAGAVGLLLHLESWCSFHPEHDFSQTLAAVLTRHEPAFNFLPSRAAEVLRELMAGKWKELVHRPGKLDKTLAMSLFGTGEGFPMERGFGLREPAMSEHPDSARYVQEVADRLARKVRTDFRKRGVLRELYEEGADVIAALAVLLVIEPCQVDPNLFRTCWDLYRSATAGIEYDEPDFHVPHSNCLKAALQYGVDRFSPPGARTALGD